MNVAFEIRDKDSIDMQQNLLFMWIKDDVIMKASITKP